MAKGCCRSGPSLHRFVMPARSLLQFVLLIALAFAPICGMSGTAKAAPAGGKVAGHHAAMADSSHCADMGGGEQDDHSKTGTGFDCRMACAGVLAPTPLISETQIAASVPRRVLPVVPTLGRNPTAELPPPRLS